jgi:hypothetical protein
MADSKDISFSNLEDTISAQDYDFQTIDLSSSITMASPTFTISSAPTISISNGGSGTTGSVLAAGGAIGGANIGYSNTMWTTGTSGFNGTSAAELNQSGMLSLKGKNADIDINGKSLMKTLEALEDRLNMLVPNTELEKEWDDLRRLGNRYRKLEAKCREKAEMWNKLKSMPKPNINL